MNTLKKTLTKYNPNTSHKQKIQISSTFKKKSHWDDLQSALESIQQKNMQQDNSYGIVQEHFIKIVQGNFNNGYLGSVQKLGNQLLEKYRLLGEGNNDQNVERILGVLKKMVLKQSSNIIKKYLEISVEQLMRFHQSKKRQQKQKCLKDYNKYLHNVTQATKPKQNTHLNSFLQQSSKFLTTQPQTTSKLIHSTSAVNIKLRNRSKRQQDDYDNLRKKKSLDYKHINNQDSRSVKKLDTLFKDNIKPVKTSTVNSNKKQYDFSAIFEASKSNIQSRNKTFKSSDEMKKEGSKMMKNKDKKDDAFIFYRPTNKKKI